MQHECRITVLETKVFPELQEKYLADPKSGTCPCFKAGDTFLLKRTPKQDDCETANCWRSKLRDIIGVIHSLTAPSVRERHFLSRGTARSRSFIPGKPTALLK